MIGPKRFDNILPTKESLAFQDEMKQQVDKGRQMTLFQINPAFPRRIEVDRGKKSRATVKRVENKELSNIEEKMITQLSKSSI